MQLVRMKYHHYARASWLMRLLRVYVVGAAATILVLSID
jgi:hypothetical protein